MIAAKLRQTLEFLRTITADWAGRPGRPPPGVYLGRGELLADLDADRRRPPPAGAEAAAAGAIQRHDPAGRGLRRPPADARPPPAQRPARPGARRDLPRRRRLPTTTPSSRPTSGSTSSPRELEQTRPLIPTHLAYSAETTEVVETFRTAAAILEQQCPEALDTYIISSTTEPAHLLEVLLLAREARLFRPDEGISRLDIVPLFEALEPLQTASAIMERLFAPAGLPPPPGAPRRLPGGDDRLLRQQQGERLPPVGLGPVPGADATWPRRAGEPGSRSRCSTAGAARSAAAAGRPTARSSRSRAGRSTAGSG